jgi:protein O-GlcNAc transferase
MSLTKVGELVRQGKWAEVDSILIPSLEIKDGGLEAVLLWCATLRARNEGVKANQVLADAARRRYAVDVSVWSQFAEELMQSGLWHLARDVTQKVTAVDSRLGRFLQLVFYRETENWKEFDATLATVEKEWPDIAQIQAAWGDIRRGRTDWALNRLKRFEGNTSSVILKIFARYNLAVGNINKALTFIEDAKRQQPLDWECIALEGACKPNQALELWKLSLLRQPAQLETLVNRARFYAARQDWDEVEKNCVSALNVKPWSDLPVLLWIECLCAQNKFQLAWTYLSQQLETFSTPARLAAKLDLLRTRTAKTSVLKSEAEKILGQHPTNPQVLLSAGAAFQQALEFDKAAKCYQARLQYLPSDRATRNNLAQLYFDRGDVELAIDAWREIENPDSLILVNMARALQERGDTLEAEGIYREVLTSMPMHPTAMRGLADVVAMGGDIQQAWTLAKNAIQIDPDHPRTWLLAADLQGPLGMPEKRELFLIEGEYRCSRPLILRQALFKYWRARQNYSKALDKVGEWSVAEPEEAEYFLMLADLQFDKNDFEAAEEALQKAFSIEEQIGGTALIRFYESRNRLGSACRLAEQLLRQNPDLIKSYGLYAEVLYRQQRYDKALEVIDAGLKKEPFRLSLVRQKVSMLLSQERFNEAITCARNQVSREDNLPHLALLLKALRRSRDFRAAVELCRELLQKNPGHPVFTLWLGESLAENRELPEAVATLKSAWHREPHNLKMVTAYIKCLSLDDNYIEAYSVANSVASTVRERPSGVLVLTEILQNLGRHEEALTLLEGAIDQFPSHIGLAMRRVECLRRLKMTDKEKEVILKMLDAFPTEHVLPWASSRMQQLGDTKEIKRRLTKWQENEPASIVPRWAAFTFVKAQRRYALAHQLLDAIARRKPDDPNLLLERAYLFSDAWRMSEAIALVRTAINLRPDNASLVQCLLNFLVKAGDFDEFDTLMKRLKHLYGDSHYAQYSNFFFNINCHPELTSEQIYKFYNEWYVKAVLPTRQPHKKHVNSVDPNRKLRIGYVSPDFRRHAVAYFSEPLLAEHDRYQFELFAYAHLELNAADEYTRRFRGYFDHWIETAEMSTEELEKTIREDQIDILIDLAGHTANHSLGVFLRKPAPVQASYVFGAGQTTGLPEIDYLVSDLLTVPSEHDAFVSEKAYRLPFIGLPYRPPTDYLESSQLPFFSNGCVTFGVLSRPVRTNRRVFSVWAKILHQLPNAKLRFDHIPYKELDLQKRIVRMFSTLGISERQLDFRNTRPHWKAYQEIDIQLDPFPAGSGTTITEGLWMERVAIALQSRPPMGRIACAQLSALGLAEECCADDERSYIEKAVFLGSNPQKLADISFGLRQKMLSSRLMDYKAFSKDTAIAYRKMWKTYCGDKP